jgi:hydrogenase maturation factor
LHEHVILVAYGDMLRVPVNAPKSEPRSLEQAKAAGDGMPSSRINHTLYRICQNPTA